MDKLLKYSLSSILLLCILFSNCKKAEKIEQEADENTLLTQRKSYYQGSRYRQEYSDKLISIDSTNAEYYQGKSMAHTKIGDYHIAFPLLEKAYSLDKKEIGYYYGWLLLYYYRDYERAIARLNEYDDLTPNEPDFCWGEHINFLKGLCYKQMKDYDNAINEFNTLINYEGEHVDVYGYVYRGISHLRLENYKMAIEDFDVAIKIYPNCSMAYFYKGLTYQKLGFPKLAKEAYFTAKDLLERGYIHRESYQEVFDAISVAMVDDYINNLDQI